MVFLARVRPEAESHLQEAYSWYLERSAHAAEDFISAVDSVFGHLSQFPSSNPVVYRDVHRVLLRKFPFAIYYLVKNQEIRVIGLLHVRRHPREARRLSGNPS